MKDPNMDFWNGVGATLVCLVVLTIVFMVGFGFGSQSEKAYPSKAPAAEAPE